MADYWSVLQQRASFPPLAAPLKCEVSERGRTVKALLSPKNKEENRRKEGRTFTVHCYVFRQIEPSFAQLKATT